MPEQMGNVRFWILRHAGYWYLYDFLTGTILKPPHYPQAAELEPLIPHLEKLRRRHGEAPGKPYVIDMRGRSIDVEEID